MTASQCSQQLAVFYTGLCPKSFSNVFIHDTVSAGQLILSVIDLDL